MFFEMRFDLGTLDSGERSLPFGLLVSLYLTNPAFYHVSAGMVRSFSHGDVSMVECKCMYGLAQKPNYHC